MIRSFLCGSLYTCLHSKQSGSFSTRFGSNVGSLQYFISFWSSSFNLLFSLDILGFFAALSSLSSSGFLLQFDVSSQFGFKFTSWDVIASFSIVSVFCSKEVLLVWGSSSIAFSSSFSSSFSSNCSCFIIQASYVCIS